MKKLIKTLLFGIVCTVLFNCGKSSSPIPVAGCKFTFKGTSYSYAAAICGPGSGGDTLGGVSTNGTELLSMIKGTVTFISLAFDALSGTPNVYESAAAAVDPTITISGKTWTFSGTLVNTTTAESAEISGTCNCTN